MRHGSPLVESLRVDGELAFHSGKKNSEVEWKTISDCEG